MLTFTQYLLEMVELQQSKQFRKLIFPVSIKPRNINLAMNELEKVKHQSKASKPKEDDHIYRGVYDWTKREFYVWFGADTFHNDVTNIFKLSRDTRATFYYDAIKKRVSLTMPTHTVGNDSFLETEMELRKVFLKFFGKRVDYSDENPLDFYDGEE